MLSILARSLHLRVVVGTGERLLTANQLLVLAMIRVEQLGTLGKGQRRAEESTHLGPIMLSFEHHRRVTEFLNQTILPLDG